MSNTNCSVAGCYNTKKNSPELSFYSFPKRVHEAESRKLWITAIRRTKIDGTPWEPRDHSRVCSTHFVGGKRSLDPRHPAYVPTIFPEMYKKQKLDSSAVNRYKRRIRRVNEKSVATDTTPMDTTITTPGDDSELPPGGTDAENIDVSSVDKYRSVEIQTDLSLPLLKTFELKEKKTLADIGTDAPPTLDSSLTADGFYGFKSLEKDPSNYKELLGISKEVFLLLLKILQIDSSKRSKFSTADKLVIFLFKLKHGLTYSALGIIFNCHRTTISTIFKEVLVILAESTAEPCNFIPWPSKQRIKACMPKCFREEYENVRIIIDCTEVRSETPETLEKRVFMYSAYKGAFTVKFLIGVSPCGTITFLSKAYGGRSSDSSITVDCGLIDKLEPDDIVMSDKGFPEIVNKLKEEGVIVIMPPFNFNGRLTPEEVEETKKIAKVRIHVERCIGRIKIFDILRCIPHELIEYVDKIMQVCCILVNLMPPLIKE